MKQLCNPNRPLLFIALIVLLVAIGACGGNSRSDGAAATDGSSTSANRRNEAVPTMPSARFESVGSQSTISETAVLTETEAAVSEDEPDRTPDLALGERVYANRCAECHGAQAEGDSAVAIAGLGMTEGEFIDLIRTGGELGPDHLFGTRAVSENGLTAMYAYLQSLE